MKTDYRTTIGLEIHAELKTETKMFCDCANLPAARLPDGQKQAGDPDEAKPNTNVCPICMGHPGVLPTINKRAVEHILRLGFALTGKIQERTHFDRKSYFYPDLPKGYQISQYEYPLVKGGELRGVSITRIHLEEDTARLQHPAGAGGEGESYVDFNRAGVPLMELVTEPVIDGANKALEFAKELQLILRYLGASDADMEKGQMRVEANVSVAPEGEKLGTKVELKNINSFRAVKAAIGEEVERQVKLLEKGEKVKQETRGWDEKKGTTVPQRSKEEAEDYRYMPEPDLPPMNFTVSGGIDLEKVRVSVPELPEEKRARFQKEFGLREDQVEVLAHDRALAEFFEETVSELGTLLKGEAKDAAFQLLANYTTSDFVGLMKENGIALAESKITPENFAELIVLIDRGEITSRVAKDVLRVMSETGADPDTVVKEKELGQISDEAAISEAVREVISENQTAANDFKDGKEAALKFLVGQAMAKLRGRGNPELIEKALKRALRR